MHYSAWQHGALSVTENNTNSLKKLKQVFSLKQIPNVYMLTLCLCQLKVWGPHFQLEARTSFMPFGTEAV